MARHLLKRAQRYTGQVVIALAGLLEGDETGPKWVQVTREGDFPGYLGGLKPFAFQRKDLDAMVSNIKTHPSFAMGADGVAVGKVIPWDFNHASEAPPTDGNLAATGSPSQGWTLDMEVRLNAATGNAELWALTQFLEPARTYVKAEQYLWASVSVAFNAVHPETSQNVGALVTSIALTNTPFVEGMSQLAASQRRPSMNGDVEARRTWFEAAQDPSQAISMMREMFALPETAGAAEVMGQVAVVQGWLESGTAPLGTNPEELVGSMRTILNLPALTSQIEVLSAASTSVQALLEEQAAAAGVPAATETTGDGGMSLPEPSDIAAARQKDTKAMDELIKILAAALGVSESEAAVKRAVTELAQLRDSLTLAMGLSRDGSTVILGAAKEGVDAKARLLALFEALEVGDPEAALAKVASTMEAAKKLAEVMPELEGLQIDKKEADEASAESDVDSAIAASKLPASVKPALLLQRTSDPKGFAEAYPKPVAGAVVNQHLLARANGGAAGTVKATALDDGTGVKLTATPDGTINLADLGGRNRIACAKLHLQGTHANWATMTNDEQFLAARNFANKPGVVYQPAAV